MNQQLSEYLEENSWLDDTQHGFRKHHSTESALVIATEEIREVLDRGGTAALILLDLSAAFDTVSHGILADRIHRLAIEGTAFDLLLSFLANRQNNVKMGHFVSRSFSLPCGVPQGSALSPTLINLSVTPPAPIIKKAGFSLASYADDIQIVVSLANPESNLGAAFSSCMSKVSNWMDCNCLKLNANKTEVIIFGNKPSFWIPDWWPPEMDSLPKPSNKVRVCGRQGPSKQNNLGRFLLP